MIRRIVKLTFKPEHIEEFKAMFGEIKNGVAGSEGCLSVDLLQDVNNPHIFFTYSFWKSEDYLNQYRHSEFFGTIWPKMKALFGDKPEAWSTAFLDSAKHPA